MTSTKVWALGVVALACSSPALRAQAQIPALPGGAGAASSALGGVGGLGGGAAGGATATQPTTLWSFLGLSSNNLQACRAKICASQFGQMANSMVTGPMAGITGGFIPALCPPTASASQLQQLQQIPGGAQATAAQIQASEANAKARVAAVEYLATVDCTRWPEAQKALLFALRQDTNECVRFAAARGFNTGCCCNKAVIDALRICVAGETSDGHPAETSPRVKAAAFTALQHCLMCLPEDLPEEKPPAQREQSRPPAPNPPPAAQPERSTMIAPEATHVVTAYSPSAPHQKPAELERLVPQKTFAQTVEEARRTLVQTAQNPRHPITVPTGKRSVLGALVKARQDAYAVAVERAKEHGRPQPPVGPVDAPAEPRE
jgi:hypothetical protein